MSDVAEAEEHAEPDFTHHAGCCDIFIQFFFLLQKRLVE